MEMLFIVIIMVSFQEIAGLRLEVSAVTSNFTGELDRVAQQKHQEITELEVCIYVCVSVFVHVRQHGCI